MKSVPPKVNLDPNPPKYTTPVPTVPRSPRIPSDMESLLPTDPATRDTDPVRAESGEHEVAEDADKTPVETMYGLKSFARELKQLTVATKASTQASRDAANAAIETRSEIRAVVDEMKSLTKRVTALEVSSKWAPLTLSAVSLILVVWLGFQAQQTQAQVQQLQAQLALLKRQ